MAIVPNLSDCQPRFVLYCQAHDLVEGDEWQTWDYMTWIEHLTADYKRERHIRSTQPILDHDDFTRFIESKVSTS